MSTLSAEAGFFLLLPETWITVVRSGALWGVLVSNDVACRDGGFRTLLGDESNFAAGKGTAALFMGEYQHSLDSKGRLIVPARFREGLGETFIVTRGLDHCLFAYPMSEWSIIEEKLKSLPLTQSDARALSASFQVQRSAKWTSKEELRCRPICGSMGNWKKTSFQLRGFQLEWNSEPGSVGNVHEASSESLTLSPRK